MVTKKVTTIRLSEEFATTVEVVARGRAVSVNTLVVDALTAEIERVRHDEAFMANLREIDEHDRDILDRLAERRNEVSSELRNLDPWSLRV